MTAPRHVVRISTFALTLAALATLSTPPAFARGLGAMSMPSISTGPRLNMHMNALPAVQRNSGDPHAKMLGGPDTKTLGGPDTKSNPGCEKSQVAGCSNNLFPADRATGAQGLGMEERGIIIIGGKKSPGQRIKKTSTEPTDAAAIKGFNPQPDPPGSTFVAN